MPVLALLAPWAPPPHIDVVSLATETQVLPLQQPVVHKLAEQTHWPALQLVPQTQNHGNSAGQPVAATQEPAVMQGSEVVQVTVVPPPHTPALQVAPVLHMLPVLHDPEFFATAAGQTVAGPQAQ